MPRRTDSNQREIVDILRKCGAIVHVTSDFGKGFPDLVCSISDKLWLIEIKDGKKTPSAQKLTPRESDFFDKFGKHVKIINSIDNAINFVNEQRKGF